MHRPDPETNLIDRSAEGPFPLFEAWMEKARGSEPNDPNAMALATCNGEGVPNVRMVLLKEAGPSGFVFFTNLESSKGRELLAVPRAALCFHWKSLRRQIRVRGHITPVGGAEADAYFASRARESQIGAWASRQSRPLPGRLALEKEIAMRAAQFGFGKIPRPAHWSGFRLMPLEIEFWRDRPFRLHDRLLYRRTDTDEASAWYAEALYP